MAKKQFFILFDCETSIDSHIVDAGAIVVDKKGKIYAELAVLVADFYLTEELFYDKKNEGIWGFANLEKRKANYRDMLDKGTRTLASVAAVNRWLAKCAEAYHPEFLAYNSAFDLDKGRKSGLLLDELFPVNHCLWGIFNKHFAQTKEYKQFIVDNHYFTNRTEYGNMSYKTSCEVAAHFVRGAYEVEPHCAREDLTFELDVLKACWKKKNWRESMPYDWRKMQVRDHFTAK